MFLDDQEDEKGAIEHASHQVYELGFFFKMLMFFNLEVDKYLAVDAPLRFTHLLCRSSAVLAY